MVLIFWVMMNPNVTWEIIRTTSRRYFLSIYQTSLEGFSYNPNLTWEIVKTNPNIHWEWRGISRNKNISWQIVLENLSCPWDWEAISAKPEITLDTVQNHPELPWDYKGLLGNPNLTLDFFKKYQDKFIEPNNEGIADFENFVLNYFDLDDDEYCYFIPKNVINDEIEVLTKNGLIRDIAKMVTSYYDSDVS